MNFVIETLNVWADHALRFAWPMLWQSSLLIGLLFALDLLLRRRARPAVRYALWLVVLVKLLLPPSLAFPTSPGWWLRPTKASPARPRLTSVVVTYRAAEVPVLPAAVTPVFVAPPRPHLSPAAWAFVGMVTVSLGLLAWMLARWYQVARDARRAAAAPAWLSELLPVLRRPVRLRLTDCPQSPAVCGLFRPVILLPRSLAEQLPPAQLRAVLLHELLHLRRGDVWVNCAQALLQIVYWWHPLLWVANARIRRVREEAVDDAVMLALNEDAEAYAPTLLEVAKLALHRPLASLGLVGILESQSSLRQRIERLMDFRPPRHAGLTLASALAVLGFAALALPMGEAPPPTAAPQVAESQVGTNESASNGTSSAGSPMQERLRISRLVNDGKLFYELGKPQEAEVRLKEALNQDPQNQTAAYYLKLLSEGRAKRLVDDGKLLYELGRLDAAEVKLQEALEEDPQDFRAPYYLKLVREAQHKTTGGLRKALPQRRSDGLPVPNPYSRTNLAQTTHGRLAILAKIDRIRLDSVSFNRLPLNEVVRFLAEECRKRDPDKLGVRFLILSAESTNAPPEAALDPRTGLPKPATPATLVDLSSLPITIKPPLTNVRLADVMGAIVKVAGQPIKYSIEDYAIVFSAKPSQESPPLYIRTYKVDPNAFYQGLQAEMGAAMTNRLEATPKVVVQAVVDYFARAGVDLDPKPNPGKALFWNDRAGMLVVRNTLHDLDIIEAMIQTLNVVPPQINIKCMFVEVSQDDAKALGFDWFLGNTMMTNGAVGYSIGTAPSFTGAPTAANPLGAFPGNPSPTERPSPTPPTLSGILTEPQFRMVTKALQQRTGTEILAQPEVTTISGRQAQMKMVNIQAVVKGINERALTAPGITTTNGDESSLYVTEQMEFGPTLDVIPSVLADGFTISLTVIPTVTGFLGYAEGRTNRVAVYVNGEKKWITPPVPNFRVFRMNTTVQVWDGQTVVLGGSISESVSTTSKKKNLLVFITPTLIDPAGNRLHTEKDMPFTRDGIPQQAPR